MFHFQTFPFPNPLLLGLYALKRHAECIFSSGILIFKSYSLVNVQRLILLNTLLHNELLRGIFTGSSGKFIKILELLMCNIEPKNNQLQKLIALILIFIYFYS